MGHVLEAFQRGAIYTVRRNVITVGTTVTRVARGDADRARITFVNTGTTVLNLEDTTEPSSTKGIELGPGAALIVRVDEDGVVVQSEWNAVSDAAGGSLYVREDDALETGVGA